MGNKLYVGNLPYSVRDNDLQQQFGEYGNVTSAKVMPKHKQPLKACMVKTWVAVPSL